jgi:transcriptional regulator with XRE-family HTH domain
MLYFKWRQRDMISKKELGKSIKRIREESNLSQEELASKLNLARPSISQIESGKREVSSIELAQLSRIFDFSVDELLNPTEEKKLPPKSICIDIPTFNKEKFEQVLLYLTEKCGAKPNVGETVLYKLLYFIDFNYYELHEEYLTGEAYRKINYGPAPCHFKEVVDEMVENGDLKRINAEYYGKPQRKYIPQVRPDLSKLNGQELEAIDSVVDRLSSMNASAIKDYSHEDVPFQVAEDKEIIDFETAFYRKPAYSVREYNQE